MTFNSVTLARTIWLPDDGLRTETCRNVFNVLMCKFYICAVVGVIIEQLDNMHGVTTKIVPNELLPSLDNNNLNRTVSQLFTTNQGNKERLQRRRNCSMELSRIGQE